MIQISHQTTRIISNTITNQTGLADTNQNKADKLIQTYIGSCEGIITITSQVPWYMCSTNINKIL
jgi:hypothetical protein